MNQSKLKEKTCSPRKAREIECERVIIGSGSVYLTIRPRSPQGLRVHSPWGEAKEFRHSMAIANSPLVAYM